MSAITFEDFYSICNEYSMNEEVMILLEKKHKKDNTTDAPNFIDFEEIVKQKNKETRPLPA